MSRFFLCALALCVVLPASATASSPRLRRVSATIAPDVYSDGSRYIAFGDFRAGNALIFDTAADRTWPLRLPAECAPKFSVPYGLMASQRLLMACGRVRDTGRSDHYLLLNVRSGESVELPKTYATPDGPRPAEYNELGRYWIRMGGVVPCAGCTWAYNWHTGETRLAESSDSDAVWDLDHPVLRRARLCAPWTKFQTLQLPPYEPPFLLMGRRSTDSYDGGLFLARCGSRRRLRLQSSSAYYDQVSLASRMVAWTVTEKPFVRAYDIRTKRSYRWHVPEVGATDTPAVALPTRHALVIASTIAETCDQLCAPTRRRLYEARLRR